MSRTDEFFIGHSPELVRLSQDEPWIHPGGRTTPKAMHELPHAAVMAAGAKEVSGSPIDISTDSRIPSHVYHVTTDKPAVMASGQLRPSGGAGGLGGHHVPVVSMTTDRNQAMQIHKDLKFVGDLAQRFAAHEPAYGEDRTEWGTGLVNHLTKTAEKEGWNYKGAEAPHQLAHYGTSEWMSDFYQRRSSLHPQRDKVNVNPVVLGEGYRNIDPKKVGIIRIPKEDIAGTGAMVTDFDLPRSPIEPGRTRYGLSEIRAHGNVPVRSK